MTIAAAGAAASLSAATRYEPKALSSSRFELLSAAVDRIVPASETPGAREAGVPQILDQVAQRDPEFLTALEEAADALDREAFGDKGSAEQHAALTRWMNGGRDDRRRFQLLKDWTVDAYYACEVGLVDELGYQGNTYVAEFRGCRHESHQERG